MKTAVYIWCSLAVMTLTACDTGDGKSSQAIDFGELVPQNLMDGSLQLKAAASSGLPVTFRSSNTDIAVIKGNTVEFVTHGTAYITAEQPGNELFHEAPNITRELRIRDWDPNKKGQVITFNKLPERLSNDDPALQLVAVSTSGLPVKFTTNDWKGVITSDNLLVLYHGTYTYDAYISITASQDGDSTYNPAENVVQTIHAIGDGTHL